MEEAVIKTTHLNVGYNKKTVISDIDLNALKGEVVCLLGPNGAGKSTILKTLSGLLAPLSGTAELDGEGINGIDKKSLSRRLSLVLTDGPVPAMTTVFDLVSMGRAPYTNFMGQLSDNDRRIIDAALAETGISGLRDRYVSELSDGEKQKAMIARAIVQEPEVIILDEPTGHLDIGYKVEVIRLLQKLSAEKQMTCILSLHDIDLALKGCKTIMLVNDGKISGMGAPEEIIKSGTFTELYHIKGGRYSELMGSVEIKAPLANDAFVAAGNGTGAVIYRSLARNGYGVVTGVVHENDKDHEVAAGVCSEMICEKAFEPISRGSAVKAEELALMQRFVIDSGFPVGGINAENIGLIKNIILKGKRVFSLRPVNESRRFFGELDSRIVHAGTVSELIQKIRSIF